MCVHIQEIFTLATSPSIGRGILLRTKNKLGALDHSVRGIARTQTRWASSSTPLLLGNLDGSFSQRQCQRSMEETDFWSWHTTTKKPPRAALWKSQKTYFGLWKLALGHPTKLTRAIHLSCLLQFTCTFPSLKYARALPTSGPLHTLFPLPGILPSHLMCTALHMVGTISLFQYLLRRRSPLEKSSLPTSPKKGSLSSQLGVKSRLSRCLWDVLF